MSCFSFTSLLPFFFCSTTGQPSLLSSSSNVDQPSSSIEQLPEDLVLRIFSLLPIKGLAKAEQVCKKWQHITVKNQLWERLYLQHYPRASIEGEKFVKRIFGMRLRGDAELEKARQALENPSELLAQLKETEMLIAKDSHTVTKKAFKSTEMLISRDRRFATKSAFKS